MKQSAKKPGQGANSAILPKKLVNKARSSSSAAGAKGEELRDSSRQLLNASIRDLREQGRVTEAIRELQRFDGTVGSAIFNFVEIASTTFKVWAYDASTHQISPEASLVAQTVMSLFDTVYDYTVGFSDKPTIRGAVEHMFLETVTSSGFGAELVLNKEYLPDRIQVIPYETLKWVSDGTGMRTPKQKNKQGDDIDLNLPNFFVGELHRSPASPYARPMLEPAINTTWQHNEFVQDMRRTIRQAGNPRVVAKLITEKLVAAAPLTVKNDPDELKKWLEGHREDVVAILEDLEPEQALAFFDAVEIDALKMAGEKADYVPALNASSGMVATSLKTAPSVLGLRLEGSQSLSNTESMVFLKVCNAIRKPVQDVMSRLLTLAVRLYGTDAYVKFTFDPINLRPEDEVEAFKTMRQARILELLSYGLIDDSEAFVDLGLEHAPSDYTPLSGTRFYSASSSLEKAKQASPNADPQGRALQPDAPSKGGGKSQ